ncbi:hypothetical protein C0993_006377, partial [Termitomyces sp. T159_Od127]
APLAPSFDEELKALLAGEEPLVALVHKELGLGQATEAGKGFWQGQKEEEEEGTKETMPDIMAGAATGVAMPAPRKAPTGGAKGLASPAKKGSPTKPSVKRRGRPAPRYKAPTQQDFSNKELARFLVPKQVEAVVDTGVEAGVVLKETKRKAMVDLAARQAFKEERGVLSCNKCWANNNSEGCWYSMGTPPCFSNAPDPTVEKTYHWAVLVKRAQAVEKVRKAETQGESIGISKKSLALPTRQGDEKEGSGKGKQKASLPLSPMDKGKKRVRVVSPAVVTPEVESEEDDEDEVHCLSMAIEASKVAPGAENLAGPSHQAEAPQDIGAPSEEMEQDKAEKGAEVRPEAAPQEWSANNPTT